MPVTPKILGQSAPSATTLTDVYTVPASTTTTISTIFVTNRSSTDATFRLSVADAGEANANKQYLYYDLPIAGNQTVAITCGITLEATDVVRAYASSANLSINIFGVEVS